MTLSAADTAGLPVARFPKKERQVDAMRHVCFTPRSTATDETRFAPNTIRMAFGGREVRSFRPCTCRGQVQRLVYDERSGRSRAASFHCAWRHIAHQVGT